MSDIVERLREGVWGRARRADAVIQANMQDGADEIERLRAKRDRIQAERDRLLTALLTWLCADDAGDEQERINAITQARRAVGERQP
jgi:hypothetical protein